jgi:hypothetical protein
VVFINRLQNGGRVSARLTQIDQRVGAALATTLSAAARHLRGAPEHNFTTDEGQLSAREALIQCDAVSRPNRKRARVPPPGADDYGSGEEGGNWFVAPGLDFDEMGDRPVPVALISIGGLVIGWDPMFANRFGQLF